MRSLILVTCLVLTAGYFALTARSTYGQSGATTIRSSVTGVGETKNRAQNSAERTARDVARGSYRTISTRYSGSNPNVTCILVIEYQTK